MRALRTVFRVIMHLLQALLLLSALAGGVILLISWIQQEPLIGDLDELDYWIAFTIITGVLSVACSPMLWSSYRKGPVAAAPVSPPVGQPAPPLVGPAASPLVGQTYGTAPVSAPAAPAGGMPQPGSYGMVPAGPAEPPSPPPPAGLPPEPPRHAYPPPAGQYEPGQPAAGRQPDAPPRWPSSPP